VKYNHIAFLCINGPIAKPNQNTEFETNMTCSLQSW